MRLYPVRSLSWLTRFLGLNGSSIVCDRLLLSHVGRIPTTLVTIPHAKQTAAKHMTLSPRGDDCPCETAPSSEDTINLNPSSSWTTTPKDHLTTTTTEDPCTTIQKTDNLGTDANTSVSDSGHGAASRNSTASVSASREDALQPTALPADPKIPNENICLVKYSPPSRPQNSQREHLFGQVSRLPLIISKRMKLNMT